MAAEFQPQVQSDPVQPLVTLPQPIVTPGITSEPVQIVSGHTIDVSTPDKKSVATRDIPDVPNDDYAALRSAFGALLGSLGGQSGYSSGYQSDYPDAYKGDYLGRSEIADPSGDSGANYSSPSGLTPVSAAELSGMRKIIPPFQKWFGTCTEKLGLGTCRFENLGIMGDAAHRARRSCHNSGQAIDVGTVTCSGGQKLIPSSDRFFNLANCMANDSKNELQVVFYKATGPNMIKKSDHLNHMHIQLKNCAMVYGQ